MAKLLDRMLNLVGWELEEEDQASKESEPLEIFEQEEQPEPFHIGKKSQGKVVNIHTANQFKVVIMQPETFDEAKDVCDHLKTKKPVVVNLETLEKESAQRIVDFLSGSVYALDGNIQKVSNAIFVIAPNNVDIMGDFKDEFSKNKGMFPWMK